MRSLFQILKYIRNYWNYLFISIGASIFSVFFSAISLTMVIPFLRLLFNQKKLVRKEPPTLDWSMDSMVDYFNYRLGEVIIDYGKLKGLLFICVLVIIVFFLKNFFIYLTRIMMAVVRNGVVRDIRNEVYHKVLHLPVAYFTENRKGDLMTRATSDVQEIEVSIMSMLEGIIRNPITLVTYLAIMIYMSPLLTLFVLIMLPLTGLIVGRIGKTLKKTSTQGQEQLGVLLSMLDETIVGQRIIKVFNAIGYQYKKFQRENDRHYQLMVSILRRRDLSSPLSEFLGISVVVAVLYFGGRLVLQDNIALAPENFIGFILIFSQLISPAKSFSNAYYKVQRGLASVERIEAILDKPLTIHDIPNAKSLQNISEGIEFSHVSFSYEKGQPVLKDINLSIEKGETFAIVGPSGAGKSTLIDLIPRYHDPEKGEILLDGIDIRKYKLQDLRQLMGMVTQESILFNDTIFNNIAFGQPDASKEAVQRAAKVANAHRFIVQFPREYDTNIGDQGAKLSGGQRQRLAIARAILKNPPVLILDEATSSLDTKSEKLVQKALTDLMKNRTSIVIAHRLSTIQNADKIVVLEGGQVVEKGDHNSLMEAEGAYKKLVDLQAFDA